MAEQRGWSRFRSWFRWINPASSSQQPKPAIPPQRPPSRPPPTSEPKVPSRTQPHPTPPSRSTSQPQPVAQTASQTPSKSQQATESQQATQRASKPSSPAPNAWSKPPTQIVSQSPPPTRTSPPQPPARTASWPPSLTSNSQLQKAAQTASQTPSPDPTAQSQPAIQTASKPPSPSRTSPQPGALAAFQIPSHTAAQPQAKTLTAPPSSSASCAASQLQPRTRTTTRSQTENRSTSKAAVPTSTASQPKPETKISSQTPPPPPVSQLQPATTVSKPPPPPPSPSPSQTDTEPQPAARTTSQTQSPSRPKSKPKTPTQTSSPPPSPFNMVSQSQPATKTASQPPSHTASQALTQSRATSQTQQSQQRESQRSSPSRISPSKPKSPSIPSLQPKPSSSKTAESQPALSQSLWKDTRTIAAKSSEPVLEPQTRTQRIQSQDRTEEIQSLIANAENKSTEAEATAPIVAQTSAAALETSTPQSEDSIDASIGTTLSPKSEAKREAIVNKQLKTDIESNPDETPNIQGDGEPTDKRENKVLDIVAGANTSTQIQSDMITQPTEETTILRKKQMEQQALFSGNYAAPAGSKAKVNISRPSGNIKDKSTKSETQQKGSTSPGEEAALLQQEIREGVSKLVQKVDVGNPKLPGAVRSVSVVTFSGENRGASMTAGPNAVDTDSYLYIHRGYKVNKEDENEAISEREGNSNRRSDRRSGSQPMLTCINNNVQSINNTLMYDSSCTDRNPGVHLVLSIKPKKPHMQKEKTESLEAKKAKLNLIASQKLKYEPTVRRRCLRGLFMESESDPENPQKPRRHGCRYRCPEKGNGQLKLEVGSDASHQHD